MFQAHGEEDQLVPLVWGNMTAELVRKMTKNFEFKTYKMMHTSCEEVIGSFNS